MTPIPEKDLIRFRRLADLPDDEFRALFPGLDEALRLLTAAASGLTTPGLATVECSDAETPRPETEAIG